MFRSMSTIFIQNNLRSSKKKTRKKRTKIKKYYNYPINTPPRTLIHLLILLLHKFRKERNTWHLFAPLQTPLPRLRLLHSHSHSHLLHSRRQRLLHSPAANSSSSTAAANSSSSTAAAANSFFSSASFFSPPFTLIDRTDNLPTPLNFT